MAAASAAMNRDEGALRVAIEPGEQENQEQAAHGGLLCGWSEIDLRRPDVP
jgi:hypothetical protein